VHDHAPGKELGRDYGVLSLQRGELRLRDDAAPDPATEVVDRAERLGLEQDLPSARIRISVDLPAPLGPSRPYIPTGIVSVTSFSAWTPFE